MKRTTLLVIASSLLLMSCDQKSESNSDKVSNFAKNHLANRNIYFFEIRSLFVPRWDPVMLVFGYSDNYQVCSFVLETARETSPERNFRCRLIQ